jgi:hypothetical protein
MISANICCNGAWSKQTKQERLGTTGLGYQGCNHITSLGGVAPFSEMRELIGALLVHVFLAHGVSRLSMNPKRCVYRCFVNRFQQTAGGLGLGFGLRFSAHGKSPAVK